MVNNYPAYLYHSVCLGLDPGYVGMSGWNGGFESAVLIVSGSVLPIALRQRHPVINTGKNQK